MSCLELPARDQDIQRMTALCLRGRGRIVYLGGADASGRSEFLRQVSDRLSRAAQRPMVVMGRLDETGYRPAEAPADFGRFLRQLATFVSNVKPIPQAVAPQLGILADVLAAVAKTAGGLAPLPQGDDLRRIPRSDDPDAMIDVIARACAVGPMVLMLDDVDRAVGRWMDRFMRHTLPSIVGAAPLLVLSSLRAEAPPGHADRFGALRMAREQMDRDVADWVQLRDLDATAVEDWLGPMEPAVVQSLLAITLGRAGYIHDLWNQWQDDGVVDRSAPPGLDWSWQFTDAAPYRVQPRATAAVVDRLDVTLGEPEAVEGALDVLRVAALDQDRFAVEAVAEGVHRLTGRRQHQVRSWLERLTADSAGPLIVAPVPADDMTSVELNRRLTILRFVHPLHRRALLSETGEAWRSRASAELATAMADLYAGDESQVARRIAALLLQADDYRGAERYSRQADRRPTSADLLDFAERMILMSDPGSDAVLQAAAFVFELAQGRFRRHPGVEVAPLYRSCIAWAAPFGAGDLVARSQSMLAWMLASPASIDEAEEYAALSLESARSIGSDAGIADAYHAAVECLSTRFHMNADVPAGTEYRERCARFGLRAYHHALGARDPVRIYQILGSLVAVQRHLVQSCGETKFIDHVVKAAEHIYGQCGQCAPSPGLIWGLIEFRRLADALSLVSKGMDMHEPDDTHWRLAWYHRHKGLLDFHRGDQANARRSYQEAARRFRDLQDFLSLSTVLYDQAVLEEATRNRYGAIMLMILAEQLRTTSGYAVPPEFAIRDAWVRQQRMSAAKVEELAERMGEVCEADMVVEEMRRAVELPRQEPGIEV